MRKLRNSLVGMVLAASPLFNGGCFTTRQVYDADGTYRGERTDLDAGKTLSFLGTALVGGVLSAEATGAVQSANAAHEALLMGRGLQTLGKLGEHSGEDRTQTAYAPPPFNPNYSVPEPDAKTITEPMIAAKSFLGVTPFEIPFHVVYPERFGKDYFADANILWTLDGTEIGNRSQGKVRISEPGMHWLELSVSTSRGDKYTCKSGVRVLPQFKR